MSTSGNVQRTLMGHVRAGVGFESRYDFLFAVALLIFASALLIGTAYHIQYAGSVPGIRLQHLAEGERLYAAGEFDSATEVFRTAIRIAPDDFEARFGLGVSAYAAGRAEEAMRAFQAVLHRVPTHARAHFMLGAIYLYRDDVERSAAHSRLAVHLNPSHAESHANLGTALLRQGEREEALRHYRHALELDPNLDAVRRRLQALEAR